MKYGYFDDENREYVITRPDTPLPWINYSLPEKDFGSAGVSTSGKSGKKSKSLSEHLYLGTEGYFGLISNTAGGYSFYKDARLCRLTRYRYNNVPYDTGGRYLYLRDDDNGRFWSPTWQPTRNDLEGYACRHGMGYSMIGSSS